MTNPSTPVRPHVADRAHEIGAARGKVTSETNYAKAAGLRVDGGRRAIYPSSGKTSVGKESKNRGHGREIAQKVSQPSPKDYTPQLLNFLNDIHGQVRQDDQGDYHYANVSTISLHFLLQSGIPGKELLWHWHQYFDQEHGESIYSTLSPMEDERFLSILERCDFHWKRDAIKESGLLFLEQHKHTVHLALTEFISMRIDGLWTQTESELSKQLNGYRSTEKCLDNIIDGMQTSPLAPAQRLALYEILPSPYICATAKAMLESATTPKFWKNQSVAFAPLEKRLVRLKRELRNAAMRMGVYCSVEEFEQRRQQEEERKRQEQQRNRMRQEEERRRQARKQEAWQRTHRQKAHPKNQQRTTDPYLRRVIKELELLGLVGNVSLEEVKQAYRQKAKALHPDQGGDVAAFLRLQQAYEFVLASHFHTHP